MTRLTLLAAAAVVGIGFAAQSASAAPPSVIVYPTVRPYSPPVVVTPRPLVYPVPRIDHDYVVLYRPSSWAGGFLTGGSRRFAVPRSPSVGWNFRACLPGSSAFAITTALSRGESGRLAPRVAFMPGAKKTSSTVEPSSLAERVTDLK